MTIIEDELLRILKEELIELKKRRKYLSFEISLKINEIESVKK